MQHGMTGSASQNNISDSIIIHCCTLRCNGGVGIGGNSIMIEDTWDVSASVPAAASSTAVTSTAATTTTEAAIGTNDRDHDLGRNGNVKETTTNTTTIVTSGYRDGGRDGSRGRGRGVHRFEMT